MYHGRITVFSLSCLLLTRAEGLCLSKMQKTVFSGALQHVTRLICKQTPYFANGVRFYSHDSDGAIFFACPFKTINTIYAQKTQEVMQAAIKTVNYEKMKEAISNGAKIDQRINHSFSYYTHLHAAVFEYITLPTTLHCSNSCKGMTHPELFSCSHSQKIELLLAYGADANAQTSEGLTPLMIALRYSKQIDDRCLGLVMILVMQGADVSIKDDKGKTALDYASSKEGYDEFLDLLENYHNHGACI